LCCYKRKGVPGGGESSFQRGEGGAERVGRVGGKNKWTLSHFYGEGAAGDVGIKNGGSFER